MTATRVPPTPDAPGVPDAPVVPARGVRQIPDRLAHQPALDGLRAIAVLAVILYHNGADNSITGWAKGGSVGVDIFFVLSGYLITSLLLIDHAKNGSTLSRQFWGRRLRRLVPAVLVLLVLCSLYAIFIAHPWDLSSIRGQGLATLFYAQNWTIIYGHTSFSPLSHTWSLSIEEQWYLVWPLLLGAILIISRGRYSRSLIAIVALVVGSAVLMGVLYDPVLYGRAYNGTDTRAFELLIGAGLAVFLLGRPVNLSSRYRHLVEAAGIAGMAFLVFAILDTTPGEAWMYPFGFLLVAVSTAAVIAAATLPSSQLLGPGLSWAPLCAIGLISYGLYLFHVPVFDWLTPDRVGINGWALFVLRLAVVLGIAVLSYFVVEMPIRRGWLTRRRARVVVPIAVLGTLALLLVATTGAEAEPARELQRDLLSGLVKTTPDGATRVLVAGEASTFDLAQGVGGVFRDHNTVGATVTSFCGILGGQVVAGDPPTAQVCPPRWRGDYKSAVDAFEPQVSVLMVGANEIVDRKINGVLLQPGSPELTARLQAHLEAARRYLTSGGARLVVVGMPCAEPTSGVSPQGGAIQGDPARRAWVNSELQRFADAHRVRYATLDSVLCPKGSAPAPQDGRLLAPDGVRVSRSGALAVWRRLAAIAAHAKPST